MSHGMQILLGADAGIRVYIILLICQRKQEHLPDCHRQAGFAKTVTSLLILLTVL
jgi:hypothetical protein